MEDFPRASLAGKKMTSLVMKNAKRVASAVVGQEKTGGNRLKTGFLPLAWLTL